jgi:hypothetical protein
MLDRTRKSLLEDCYNTVCAIAASPHCDEFVIGYTHQPLRARGRAYWNALAVGYPHLVGLADKMSQADALWLEKHLQIMVKENREGEDSLKNYHPEKRLLAHSASTGGKKLAADARQSSVYMAWADSNIEPNYD